jgi:hypothetical protein
MVKILWMGEFLKSGDQSDDCGDGEPGSQFPASIKMLRATQDAKHEGTAFETAPVVYTTSEDSI